MDKELDFKEDISKGYTHKGESISFGSPIYNSKIFSNLKVNAPLKTFNRHGLVTGATGTGKTKTIQVMCEKLSEKSVPILIMDIKGDISGLSQIGIINEKLSERISSLDVNWEPKAYPVEFLSISKESGIRMRATLSEFGPILFSKILELNETQQSVISVIYKFADDMRLPLVDLKDIKKLIQYINNEGKEKFKEEYGTISTASTGLILRKIIELEDQGADIFFGERSFDVEDLLRVDDRGYGYINILRLSTIQDKPKMFSTFMLSLLSEVFEKFPEVGDLDQPKLVIVIDEAHLIFKESSKTLLSQLETVIKLIRSKGVGIIFCTQSPNDIPKQILGQLGMKIQHSLRAFSAQDRQAIKLISDNFPLSKYYKTEEVITSLGIGESLITLLNEKGEPTPLVHTLINPPQSRMDIITNNEMDSIVNRSSLVFKYKESVDSDTAYELLSKKLEDFLENEKVKKNEPQKSILGELSKDPFVKSMARSATTSFVRNLTGQLTRGILGSLLKK